MLFSVVTSAAQLNTDRVITKQSADTAVKGPADDFLQGGLPRNPLFCGLHKHAELRSRPNHRTRDQGAPAGPRAPAQRKTGAAGPTRLPGEDQPSPN